LAPAPTDMSDVDIEKYPFENDNVNLSALRAGFRIAFSSRLNST
jgi:hypothetical protein